MAYFNSKLQHKSYEKGEYGDEKIRTLEETIELIKKFPWDAERALTDVQLTGPSVTICDEYFNYLKVGLYFNGKFCLYYLDNENHLYEYHAVDLEETCSIIHSFFDAQLDLQKFYRHLFNVGNKGHFVSNRFEYRIKFWRVLGVNIFLFAYTLVLLAMGVLALIEAPIPEVAIIFFVGMIAFGIVLIQILKSAMNNRDNYLQISKANDVFQFGADEGSITSYNKNNIKDIVVYQRKGYRDPNRIAVFEIVFSTDTSIKFSNLLIPASDLEVKFNSSLFKDGKKNPLKML